MNSQNKQLTAIAIAISLILVGIFWLNHNEQSTQSTFAKSKQASSMLRQPVDKTNADSSDNAQPAPQQMSPMPQVSNQQAVRLMVEMLGAFSNPQKTSDDLVNTMKRHNMYPEIQDESSEDFEAYTIRPHDGQEYGNTHFFKAQYESGEDGNLFMQHMSFDILPNTTTIKEVIQQIKESFPNLPAKPSTARKDYAMWRLDGYVLWVQKKKYEDLQNDPVQGYTEKDDGTIRVTLEFDIHPQDGKDEHSH